MGTTGGGSTGSPAAWWRPAVVGAVTAAAAWSARGRVPGGAGRWERTNHRGDVVSMLEGPAWVAGALAGLAVTPLPPRARAGMLLATAGAAVFGAVDDLTESGSAKGLRGHLGELREGRLSTGGLKVLGIGVTGLASAGLLLGRGRAGAFTRAGAGGRAVEAATAGALVAGAANLANLLDLRPGRVLKAALVAAPVLPAGPARAAVLGSSGALLLPDLRERAMLGDCGANAVGALLGAAVVHGTRGPGGGRRRALGLAAVVALTLASERVSFTRVIESTPVLRELDALGRRPPARAPAASPA